MNGIEALEFDRIRTAVARLAATAEGAQALRELEPTTDPPTIDRQQRRVAWIIRRAEEGAQLPGGDVPPVSAIFEVVARDGAVLETEAMRDLLSFLEFGHSTLGFVDAVENPPAEIAEMVAGCTVPEDLRRRLAATILPDGSVNQDAIPEIARLRADIRRLNQGLLDTAEQLIRRDRHMFQGDRPTIRDGRTVVPLAANFRGRVDGIVHEASASGETVYVEPTALVDLNNELVQAHNGVLREIRRVLRELSAMVRDILPDLRRLHAWAVGFDQLCARARYGVEHGGRILPEAERIVLRNARHPLLGESCVPLTVEYGAGTRMMVISGPNTGGKTVLLKTVGLLSMMNQAAIPVPVGDGSALPRFSHWGVDIGDEQSLDAALSTFSGHLRNLATVCSHADTGSLILLDELGSGTDPEEGAALSMAIVDHLIDRGSTVLVTTHQTVLKHYGYTRDAAENASMAFDEDTHRPTYAVVPGRPGASHALDTARQQGLDAAILERAEYYLSDRRTSVAEIISRLGDLEAELSETRATLERDRAAVAARERELREREARLEARETELRRSGLVELDRVIREARSRVEGEVRRLRERGVDLSGRDIRQAQNALADVETVRAEQEQHVRDAEDRLARRQNDDGDGGLDTTVEPGVEVSHRRTGREGVVRSVRGDRAEVQFGAIRMTVPVTELKRRRGGGNSVSPPRGTPPSVRDGAGGARIDAALELDLRGQRLQAALQELERQVDAAVLNGVGVFSVIHGMGTGVLQKGVREYLEARPEVATCEFARPEDGGFGKTIVRLA